MSKWFSLSKILVVFLLWGGELSYDLILIFFGNFFNGSSSLDYCYFLGGETGWGVGGQRGRVCEGGTGRSHVAFLSAAETHPSLKHFSHSSGVSFCGFSLVSTSMALGSLEGTVLGVRVWKVTGVLEECCFATEAANCR